MPTYEYRCQVCHKVIEVFHKFNDDGPDRCPDCHHGQLKKVMSKNTFHLKGDGWYKDGYNSK